MSRARLTCAVLNAALYSTKLCTQDNQYRPCIAKPALAPHPMLRCASQGRPGAGLSTEAGPSPASRGI